MNRGFVLGGHRKASSRRLEGIVFFIAVLATMAATSGNIRPSSSSARISWKHLGECIVRDCHGDLSYDGFRQCDEYSELLKVAEKPQLYAMTCQIDIPIVALAGYYAYVDRWPEEKLRQCLRLVSEWHDDAEMLAGQLLADLGSEWPMEDFVQEFDQIARRSGSNHRVFLAAVYSIRPQLLDAWFHNSDRTQSNPDREARVLERLYDYYSSIRKQRPTKRMSESLNAYAWIPGIPQITYLQFSNNDSDLVIAVLSNVLENMDLSDIEIRVVVNANKEIIRKHLLLDTLELSRDRKNKLEKWLDIGSKPQK